MLDPDEVACAAARPVAARVTIRRLAVEVDDDACARGEYVTAGRVQQVPRVRLLVGRRSRLIMAVDGIVPVAAAYLPLKVVLEWKSVDRHGSPVLQARLDHTNSCLRS